MPSGRVHTLTTLGLAVGSILMVDPVVSVGILSGLILSPDLDVDDGFIGLSHLRRMPVVGTALSWIWRAFWWPYSKTVPHRSAISHAPIVGTVLRVGYLTLPLLVMNFMGVPMTLPTGFGRWFIGLCLADGLHIILDWTVKHERTKERN